ncbi:glutamine--tRNA ligase/YqeY domain fusion protein [Psychroserpens sp.]|uniref:glutamine--tRNA ligase/YqeY domain fusion protein n=1 Tax=Psychroserpens sp. TaxID=2020870 RepID=UPI001B2C0434|nr:glutamine--tRNA ligase/YqeY domain fusion protein [Psychroserpens sp.]MBO6605354.1 glutamine--tRNA ligase/YqeY domain fusion protein [Psychroserpens sp.]MBO6629963.1 glutamine--tRNA ligase/YqeY domain fusion protein [Psychroserpens sp.]MBO6653837.1 glutamine--tRNA ligase/YqeY domain fusion protein [Psychroserpens sp.]MBO6682158.1 glutamine--tRNA ligase/YqeY domain fusion protein [Psychroserpens sp.]MBO6748728.1 glutamine--tRNA ligase/YqeY domain fusion protein [Psychroserpens sp.]
MSEAPKSLNFIEHIIEEDLANGLSKDKLRFRFPPEPNGYLHIGHTKAIGISFGLGEKYNAPVNLRFDDTNPAKEEQEYVDAIKRDIAWLGYEWANELYSSDYFQTLYDWAVRLIKEGKAYVDSQSSEAMAEQKGTPTQPGVDGPYRNRSVEENLDLFERMKNGEFDEGEHILRAKIDMKHPNMLMRDPIMYRVLKKHHHRTGDEWCIYPMYDWTHGESDYIEQISHSLCSLEFKPHRELYNWFKEHVYSYTSETLPMLPKQREFARLNLSYTIMSKRKLLRLVEDRVVSGWDDPRMPTISGLRRRGYTPKSIRHFIERVGVAKRENVIDVSLLEFCIREDLNQTAPRVMAVLDPVKLVITNYPEDKEEWLEAENNPEDETAGSRKVPFSRELYIEREDFKEQASNKFFRLKLGGEVRLKNAYIIKANSVEKDNDGNIIAIHCTYSTDTERKVKGTLHWVSIQHAIKAEVREYDRLFMDEAPDSHQDKDFMEFLNPDSLKVVEAYLEPSLSSAKIGDRFQFQRLGYFNVDDDATAEHLVFNKTVGLRDSWAKQKPKPQQQQQAQKPQQKRPAIEVIKQLGKKYTNLPDAKREKVRAEILQLAERVNYDDIQPLFNTAVKKAGTRIATMLALSVLLKNGQERNDDINAFIDKALEDKNALLVNEAQAI